MDHIPAKAISKPPRSLALSSNNDIMVSLSSLLSPIASTWDATNLCCFDINNPGTYSSSWEGVECIYDQVVSIVLASYDLSSLSLQDLEPISGLTNLTRLDLSSSGIGGTIPPSFSSLEQILHFDLYSCSISGSLPTSLAAWSNIQYFCVSSNFISGKLPDSWGDHWMNIEEFWVGTNQIGGTLPENLSNWSRIKIFSIWGNEFTGLCCAFFLFCKGL